MTLCVLFPNTQSVQCPHIDSLRTEAQRQEATFEAFILALMCSIQAAPVPHISVLVLSTCSEKHFYPSSLLGHQGSILLGFGGVHSQALSMVPLVNPGPIYSGAIRDCHLYVLIYDMGRLLPISEPQFPP